MNANEATIRSAMHDLQSELAELRDIEGARARLAAREAAVLVRIAGLEARVLNISVDGRRLAIADPVRAEICVATGWSDMHAHTRISRARLLVDALPLTLAALQTASIDEAQARAIVDAAHRFLDDNDECLAYFAGELESILLPQLLGSATPVPLQRIRSACNRAIRTIDPDGEAQRHRRARSRRDVWVRDEGDGVSMLFARLTSVAAHACMRRIDLLASAAIAGDERSEVAAGADRPHGEWRADAFETLVFQGNRNLAAHVDVVIALPTLLGLQQGAVTLDGYATEESQAVRQLLCTPDADVTLRRLVSDPVTGALLDVGRRRYAAPESLREFIVIRDQRCRFPGCSRPAHRADIDHALPWDRGGTTDRGNLGALCRRHHLLKTHAGYDIVASAADGSCTWRTPAGQLIEHAAEPLPGVASSRWDDPPPY